LNYISAEHKKIFEFEGGKSIVESTRYLYTNKVKKILEGILFDIRKNKIG